MDSIRVSSSDLKFKRGDKWAAAFFYVNADGTPMDLTGCSARMHLKEKVDADAALELGSATGELVITPLAGKIELSVLKAVTAQVAPKTYLSDLEVTFADGEPQSTETFNVIVEEDVTV